MSETVKKILCAAMALGLLVSSFSACGKKDEEEESITRNPNVIEAPATEPAAPTTEATTAATTEPATQAPQQSQKPQQPQKPAKPQGGSSMNGTDFTTQMIKAFGYNYDTKEDCFYTEINSWQRQGNFIGHYDAVAKFGNMRYKTTKIDFDARDESGKPYSWRFQLWKGQYGPFGGAEIGAYMKEPGSSDENPNATDELYYCADDDHLFSMEFTLYMNSEDYYMSRKFFTRPWQKHWWLTGFKQPNGSLDPEKLVMQARIRMPNGEMADGMEAGLQKAGFTKGDALATMDTYKRVGWDFFLLWNEVGNLNY